MDVPTLQPVLDSGSVYYDPSWSACMYVCREGLLTCLGILCRHIDEVQSTWRQCHGKGCQELWVSWATRMEEQTGISWNNNKLFEITSTENV